MDDIDQLVKRTLAQVLCVPMEELSDTARLVDDLGADSLDPIEVAMEIEGQTGCGPIDQAMSAAVTVRDAIDVVRAAVAAKAAA